MIVDDSDDEVVWAPKRTNLEQINIGVNIGRNEESLPNERPVNPVAEYDPDFELPDDLCRPSRPEVIEVGLMQQCCILAVFWKYPKGPSPGIF